MTEGPSGWKLAPPFNGYSKELDLPRAYFPQSSILLISLCILYRVTRALDREQKVDCSGSKEEMKIPSDHIGVM